MPTTTLKFLFFRSRKGNPYYLEAQIIYKNLFNNDIPVFVQKNFIKISKRLDNNYSEKDVSEYYKYIEKVKDLEALELTARYCGKLRLLTDKFKAMVYIAETVPENYDVFFNEKSNILKGYFTVIFWSFRTIPKMIKGLYLLRF